MAKGYHHMTHDIRCQIYTLKANHFSLRAIAKQIGYDVSSVSREIKRNTGQRGYRYCQADRLADERRRAASSTPKKLTPDLRDRVIAGIQEDWSPEQLSGRLKLEDDTTLSHERIYQLIWLDKRAGGRLYQHLRHRGKRYNKRSSGKAGRGYIPGRVDIAERPKIVEEKSRIGDWEGDTIIGAQHGGAIVTHVDRHSKFTLMKKVARRQAALVCKATLEKMSDLPHPINTITYDNGKEFSKHLELSQALNTSCYFATPYHSWERGLNEHTNGLIRQYLPKSTCFSEVSDELIQVIEDKLNHRPRKALNYKTPFEVFYGMPSPNLGVALHN